MADSALVKLSDALAGFRGLDTADEPRILRCLVEVMQGTEVADAWRETAASDLRLKVMSGAMSNHVLAVRHVARDLPVALLRVYGGEHEYLFRRAEEIHNFAEIARAGAGPRLYATFPGGRIEQWLDGQVLDFARIRQPAYSRLVARKMRAFHDLELTPFDTREETATQGHPDGIFVRLREWLATAQQLADEKLASAFALAGQAEEIAAWEGRLSPLRLPESFCHNDLQCGNVLVTHAADTGEPLEARLIDFEYAHRAYSAFDMADHLVEWGYDYDSEAPHVCHRDMLPTESERRAYVAAYLGKDVSDPAVSDMDLQVQATMPLAHLLWGIWACVQAATSSVDFDFVAYGTHRLALVELHRGEAERACAALSAARGTGGARTTADSSPLAQAQ